MTGKGVIKKRKRRLLNKRRTLKGVTIGKIGACILLTSPYAQTQAEPAFTPPENETQVVLSDKETTENKEKGNRPENQTTCTFLNDAQCWNVDLRSGVVRLSDGSNLKDKVVYQSASSQEPAILPVFKDFKERLFHNRVYLSVIERKPGPISDVVTEPPQFCLTVLAFDPTAQGRLVWSFVPESFMPRDERKKLEEFISSPNPLSTGIDVVACDGSDVLIIKLVLPTNDSTLEWSIDASSGTVLSFQISKD